MERISQTELKCTWSSQKMATKEMYRAVPIDKMPCFQAIKSKNVEIRNLSDEQNNNIRNMMLHSLPNSAFAIHKTGRRIHPNVNEPSPKLIPHTVCNLEWRNINFIMDVAAQSVVLME